MGYHAFVLRYSVYTEGENNEDMFSMPGKEAKPSCIFPKPMQDIGAAMMYIRKHSKEWKVNMEKVAICGFSAGAHNCAMYSVYYDKEEIAGFFGMEAEQMRPAAVILGYTMSDYTIMLDEERKAADPVAAQLFRASCLSYLGTEEPDEEMIRKVSPSFHVNANTPPVFLWATSADSLVPVQNSIVMAKALADAAVPFEIHIFEEGMHGLSTASQASAGNLWEVNREAAEWLPMCREWLHKRFSLPLDEKPFWADLQ